MRGQRVDDFDTGLELNFLAKHPKGALLLDDAAAERVLRLEAADEDDVVLVLHAVLEMVKDNVRQAFAIHGEPEKVSAMVDLMHDLGIANAIAPMPGQTYKFD